MIFVNMLKIPFIINPSNNINTRMNVSELSKYVISALKVHQPDLLPTDVWSSGDLPVKIPSQFISRRL